MSALGRRLQRGRRCTSVSKKIFAPVKSTCVTSSFFSPHSELSAAFAWHEPVRHHLKVHVHGQEGDQQAAQTEGEEERVNGGTEECRQRIMTRWMQFEKRMKH